MLEPFVEAGTLVLLNASAAAPPPSTTPADAALVPLFEGEWPPPRRAWLAGEARRDEAAQVQACLPHARDAGGWMAVVEAPYDLVVLNETAAAAADGGSEPTCEELRVPDAPAVRIAVAKYAASSDDDAAALPPRPLSVTHAYRAAEFGRCALRSGALRVDIADTVLLVNPGRWAAGAAEAPAATALLAPTALGVRRFERAPLADGAELDPSAIALQLACDASTLALPQPPADGSAGDEWTARAAVELADGDGATMLRQGVARSEALDLRRRLLARIPPEKQTTRVFANLMCQVYDGAAASPGLDPLCEPLDADLLRLATHGRALAVARTLLGETARLHNAGLALVFPPPHSADRPPSTDPHEAHQDQPINSAAAWAGRVPPPTHPLSVQALWLLDDFGFCNGATWSVPRSQRRPEHVELWAANGSARRIARGLFPVRFVSGDAGDVVFALGSLWHSSSTYDVRCAAAAAGPGGAPPSPRLALLYEYAPAFVRPLHRFRPELLQRSVPRAHWGLFSTVDPPPAAAALRAGDTDGGSGGCPENGDVVSAYEWASWVAAAPHCVSIRSRIALRDGAGLMPVFGLGTGGPDDDPEAIATAVRAGYRLIDTAELYDNEEIVGEGIRRSGVHRDSLFLSSKHGRWCDGEPPPAVAAAVPAEHRGIRGVYPTSRGTLGRGVCIGGAAAVRAALGASLRRLGVDYLDLYLLHWPMTTAGYALDDGRHAAVRLEAWRALVEMKREGLVRAIGVSNFSPRQLRPLIAVEAPAVLQVELHPLLQRAELREFCAAHGIALQAYGNFRREVREHPFVAAAAAAARADLAALSPEPAALLALRWTLQAGAALIPRSRRPEQITANKHVFAPAVARALGGDAMARWAAIDANASLYGLHEAFVGDAIA